MEFTNSYDSTPMQDHKLLIQGEKPLHVNKLSRREMDSLIALCDTFLSSVDPPDGADQSTVRFFQTSASVTGTPEHLGGLISQRLGQFHTILLRFGLLLLSTWIGTFLVGGTTSFSSDFPYFQKFSEVSPRKRQEIARSWSNSWFFLWRMLFLASKILILLAFFTLVDEKNENLSWEAIGYCGPDPDSKTSTDPTEEDIYGPLYKGVISVANPRETLAQSLSQLGFYASIRRNHKAKSSRLRPTMIVRCDAVVVGSGSGGSVVAGVLAKAGYKVLVLEKGDYYARSQLSLLEGPTLDQMYLRAGLLMTQDLGVMLLAGSTVGGGSAINWSASIQTPPHVIKEWSESYELELFDSPLYKEALDVVCQRMEVQSEANKEGFNNAVLRKGCMELGYPVRDIPRNAPADHYCGWCCLGCKSGGKKSTTETWLKDLVDSGNGAILSNCKVTKVLHQRKKGRDQATATGVAFEFGYKDAKEQCIVESRVTIVACGALSTPSLLIKSGLKNPNIGRNLHVHPVTMAWGYFPDQNLNQDPWPEKEKTSYEGGIMTAMSTVVGNFDSSGYGVVIQTPSLHPGLFSGLMPWTSAADIKSRMLRFSRTAHIFALARDVGSGHVSPTGGLWYKMDKSDEENLQRGIEKMLRILAAAGAHEIGTHHLQGETINVKKVSSHEFERFVKRESKRALSWLSSPIASAHQMGSCRAGVDPKTSAVNPNGETWEVEGLYVADTSVFPTALGVNPMVTVQAIAYCTAQSVLHSLKRKRSS